LLRRRKMETKDWKKYGQTERRKRIVNFRFLNEQRGGKWALLSGRIRPAHTKNKFRNGAKEIIRGKIVFEIDGWTRVITERENNGERDTKRKRGERSREFTFWLEGNPFSTKMQSKAMSRT
jgi:hypothetical protein